MICGKFNLQIFDPPSNERHIWHHKHPNADVISKVFEGFDWDGAFTNKSADEKVTIFIKTILSIMSNFILNELVTIDGRDPHLD